MKTSALLGAATLAALAAAPAHAHFRLTSHDSRHGGTDATIKVGPCGVADSQRGSSVYTVEAGSTLMLVFEEYIEHPGWYRVALDLDGNDDFVDPATETDYEANGMFPAGPVLLTDIADMPGATEEAPNIYMQAVDIPPGVECDNCTLQVIQVMTESFGTNQDIYYECLDLVIVDPAAGTPDAGPGGGEEPGGEEPTDPGAEPTVTGGCASAGGAGNSVMLLLVLGLLVSIRRRRR